MSHTRATMDDNLPNVHDLVSADHRITLREMAETVDISKDRVHYFVHEKSVDALGVMFTHFAQQAQSWDHFPAVFYSFVTIDQRCQIGRIWLRTGAPSNVFLRLGPVRILFVSKIEKSVQTFESNEKVIAAWQAYVADSQRTYLLFNERSWSITISSVKSWRETLLKNKLAFFAKKNFL